LAVRYGNLVVHKIVMEAELQNSVRNRRVKNKHDLKPLVRLFAQSVPFSAQFRQQTTLSRFDNARASDNIRQQSQ
jgi:hypothetical protein